MTRTSTANRECIYECLGGRPASVALYFPEGAGAPVPRPSVVSIIYGTVITVDRMKHLADGTGRGCQGARLPVSHILFHFVFSKK